MRYINIVEQHPGEDYQTMLSLEATKNRRAPIFVCVLLICSSADHSSIGLVALHISLWRVTLESSMSSLCLCQNASFCRHVAARGRRGVLRSCEAAHENFEERGRVTFLRDFPFLRKFQSSNRFLRDRC